MTAQPDRPTFFKTYTDRPSNRQRVNPVSAKKRATFDWKPAVRRRVFERDGGCLLAGEGWGPCAGDKLTPHHRRKASAGGAYSEFNLATLCAHHNDQIEADADLAAHCRSIGLVLRPGDEGYERAGTNRARLMESWPTEEKP